MTYQTSEITPDPDLDQNGILRASYKSVFGEDLDAKKILHKEGVFIKALKANIIATERIMNLPDPTIKKPRPARTPTSSNVQ